MKIVVHHAPRFSEQAAANIAASVFGVPSTAQMLPSERDQNFQILNPSGASFVLKLANSEESFEVLDFQNKALEHLAARASALQIPRIKSALNGEQIARVTGPDGRLHFVRMLTYLPGKPLAHVRPHHSDLLTGLGERLGEMDRALEDFSHPAMNRPLHWNLSEALWIREHFWRLGNPKQRHIVEQFVERFERHVAPMLASLRTSVIHNDWNDYNVLVSTSPAGELEVIGSVDFGDMLRSVTVADLATAATYVMLGKPDPVAAAAAVARGYHRIYPLTEDEVAVLYDLIRARLCVSVMMAACQQEAAPENEYLHISQQQIWTLLEQLESVSPEWALYMFRHAAGLVPCPQTQAIVGWLTDNRERISRVVDYDLARAPTVEFDLSPEGVDVLNPSDLADHDRFSKLVFEKIAATGAQVAVGRYDEPRLMYSGPLFEQPGNDGPTHRTVHTAIDLFLPAGSQIYSPLDGVVHSCRNNSAPQDYGPTVILEHQTDQGLPFFTLYGHLSLDSLEGKREKMTVKRGDPIGELGDARVNGGWAPHLHFQLIADLLGHSGDFPGVTAIGEREVRLSVSPNPNVILGLPDAQSCVHRREDQNIVRRRRAHIGSNLSVSYRVPLTIVRGFMQFLYDDHALSYLDAVNNVAHVGHSHPHLVRAVSDQLAVLNTNTRYLHENLVRYAERLVQLMPSPLTVCYLVNSGSEANELAMRLARTFTRSTDIIVIDEAYHGNTTMLIDISPYKFDGVGGQGIPDFVRKVPMPDRYRGPHREDAGGLGERYSTYVAQAVEHIRAAGRGVAAFFAESLLSCGGQIVLPDGFLRSAYKTVRGAGGVCVADEVQVGFGRVGTHMWGFETQGVIPDIVTLGKPIGNGFPLGAVVTRPEIAAAFDNGMEYFNTFGGNPVACAAGLAVLDVLEGERLQENARTVGGYLKEALTGLARRHSLIGDVRGLGLFLGIELVVDRTTRAPATRQARYVINRARERGILLSTDGPDANVIKIKPPMIFSKADADRLVETLDVILGEDLAHEPSHLY